MGKGSLQGRLALVTGASSGLGVDFARELAGWGCNLILVARREDRLQAVGQEMVDRFGVAVHVVPADLASEEARVHLYERVQAMDQTVDVLVNNAGFGIYGMSWEIPWERERQMLNLDVVALAHLTKLFLKDMLAQDYGYILQVASIGAYQPSPTYASYSAAKRYVLDYGEALNYELRNTNVSVTVVSPGVTRTEFHDVAEQELTLYQRLVLMESTDVARSGIEAMLQGKPSVMPGLLNKLTVLSLRFIPRRLQAALAYRTMTMG